MDYVIQTSTGTITVVHDSRLAYKGLVLVGQEEEFWNEPIQGNFVYLRDMLDEKIDRSFDHDLVPKTHGIRSLGTLTYAFKDAHLVGGLYLLGTKVLSAAANQVTLSGKDGQLVRIQSVGTANVEIGSTSTTGKVVLISDLVLKQNKTISNEDNSAVKVANGLEVVGAIQCTTVNNVDVTKLALKTEIPDISGKADKSAIPTKVSQLTNDLGYLTAHQSLAAYETIVNVDSKVATAVSTLKGSVPSTHDTLNKLKLAYEASIASTNSTVATNKTDATTRDNALQASIDSEKTRAQGAETALSNSLNEEITRAKQAESVNASNISLEVTRAQGVEANLGNLLSNEVDRAEAAEATISASVLTEKNRALAAESALAASIQTEKDRALGAEYDLRTEVDSIRTLLQSDDLTLDSVQELVNAIKANRADLALIDLSTKVTRGECTTAKIGGDGIIIS